MRKKQSGREKRENKTERKRGKEKEKEETEDEETRGKEAAGQTSTYLSTSRGRRGCSGSSR